MLTPSLFNDNFDLFDHFYENSWPLFDDRAFRNLEKKLYGPFQEEIHHSQTSD